MKTIISEDFKNKMEKLIHNEFECSNNERVIFSNWSYDFKCGFYPVLEISFGFISNFPGQEGYENE